MNQEYWNKALAFHGHSCPGLAIGLRACEAVAEKMGVSPAFDEEMVCITENDTCSVDAIQAVMSCTLGKGNLIYKNIGKQAYTFICRKTGRAMRFYMKARQNGMAPAEFREYILRAPVDELFSYQKVKVEMPEPARRFESVACELCGESAAELKIRLQEGKKVCLSCFREYSRW